MSKKKVFPDASVSFVIEANEDMEEFMKQQMSALNTLQEAVEKRIDELFKEKIGIDGGSDEAKNIAKQLFAIGYQLGWNDCRSVCVDCKTK